MENALDRGAKIRILTGNYLGITQPSALYLLKHRLGDRADPGNYQDFYDTFVDLFDHHSVIIDDDVLKNYSKSWHRPAVQKDLERYDAGRSEEMSEINIQPLFEPRGAQIEALCALENTRAEGGISIRLYVV